MAKNYAWTSISPGIAFAVCHANETPPGAVLAQLWVGTQQAAVVISIHHEGFKCNGMKAMLPI